MTVVTHLLSWRPPTLRGVALAVVLTSGVLAAQAADGRAAQYYEDALVRYEKKDLAGAIIQLKNAIKVDGRMLPVHVLLGKALLDNGEPAAAEAAFEEALRLGVNRAEVVVPLARALVGQAKQQGLFDQPRFADSGLPPAVRLQLLLVKAGAAGDLGDRKAALQALDDARTIDAANPDTWVAEVPVRWNDVAGSKVSLLGGVDAFLDLARVRWYHLTGRYRLTERSE